AAMQRGGQLHVEPLLERLQPAKCHAYSAIGLAAGDQLQQLVAGSRKVDPLDLEVVSREDAESISRGDARMADRIDVPAELDLSRHAPRSDDRGIHRRAADRRKPW